MSNIIPQDLRENIIEVREGLLDFTVPAIVVQKPSNLLAINLNQTNTFSNAAVSVKLEIPNEFNVVQKEILWRQSFSVKVSGNSYTNGVLEANRPLYEYGCFAPRSNALSKIVNTATLTFGGSSYSMTLGSVVDMLERYNTVAPEKYRSQLSPVWVDQTINNDDLANTPRNPLGGFKDVGCEDGMPRNTVPFTVSKNSATAFEFVIQLEDYIPLAPLKSNINLSGGGGDYGLSHLTSLNLDLTFFAGALGQRLFSFARNRAGGNVLNITNIDVQLLQPEFRYITVSTNMDAVPNLVYYPLKTIERLPQTFNVPFGVSTPVSSPVITVSRIPTAVLFALKPTQNLMLYANRGSTPATSTIDGSQRADHFTRITNVNINFDGATLLSNSKSPDLYKMCAENGLVDNYAIFNGLPLQSGLNAVNGAGDYLPRTITPSGACVRLEFGRNISLRRNLAPMVSYRTQFQIFANVENYDPNCETYDLMTVMCYDNIMCAWDTNLTAISYAPLSEGDAINAHRKNNSVHSDFLRDPQLNGTGLFDGGLSKIISHAKHILPHIKQFYDSSTGQMLRGKVKDYLKDNSMATSAMNAIGFGNSGGAPSGGSMASKQMLKHSLL
jgi:hypothetical protein